MQIRAHPHHKSSQDHTVSQTQPSSKCEQKLPGIVSGKFMAAFTSPVMANKRQSFNLNKSSIQKPQIIASVKSFAQPKLSRNSQRNVPKAVHSSFSHGAQKNQNNTTLRAENAIAISAYSKNNMVGLNTNQAPINTNTKNASTEIVSVVVSNDGGEKFHFPYRVGGTPPKRKHTVSKGNTNATTDRKIFSNGNITKSGGEQFPAGQLSSQGRVFAGLNGAVNIMRLPQPRFSRQVVMNATMQPSQDQYEFKKTDKQLLNHDVDTFKVDSHLEFNDNKKVHEEYWQHQMNNDILNKKSETDITENEKEIEQSGIKQKLMNRLPFLKSNNPMAKLLLVFLFAPKGILVFGGPLLLKQYLPKNLVTFMSQISPEIAGLVLFKLGISYLIYNMANALRRFISVASDMEKFVEFHTQPKPSLLRRAINGATNLAGFSIVSKLVFLLTRRQTGFVLVSSGTVFFFCLSQFIKDYVRISNDADKAAERIQKRKEMKQQEFQQSSSAAIGGKQQMA